MYSTLTNKDLELHLNSELFSLSVLKTKLYICCLNRWCLVDIFPGKLWCTDVKCSCWPG